MPKKSKNRKKLTTLRQLIDYLNDKSLMIKTASRNFFKDADIGMRKHKDKKKYSRKKKHKRDWTDED